MAHCGLDYGHDDVAGDDELRMISDINIIPLVDVMLVLLIVFMVAAPLSFSGIAVNLPSTALAPTSHEDLAKLLVVSVSQDGSTYVDKEQVSGERLETLLREALAAHAMTTLVVRADKDVPYERVVRVMSIGKRVGVRKISLITEVEELSF